jgi:hypothetical protein
MSANQNRKEKAPTLSLPKRNQSRRNPFLFNTSSIEEEPNGVNYSTIENAINKQRRQRKAAEEKQRREEEEKYRRHLFMFEQRLEMERSAVNRVRRQQQELAQAKMEYNKRIRLGIEQPRYSGNNERSGKQGGKYKTKRRHYRTSRKRTSS